MAEFKSPIQIETAKNIFNMISRQSVKEKATYMCMSYVYMYMHYLVVSVIVDVA